MLLPICVTSSLLAAALFGAMYICFSFAEAAIARCRAIG